MCVTIETKRKRLWPTWPGRGWSLAVGCYPHPVDLPPSSSASARAYFEVGSAVVTPPEGRWGFRERGTTLDFLRSSGAVGWGHGVEFCEVSQFGLVLEGHEPEQRNFGWHTCMLVAEYPLTEKFSNETMKQDIIDIITRRWEVPGQTRKTTLLGHRMVDTHGVLQQILIGQHVFFYGFRVRDEDPSKVVIDDWVRFQGEIVFRFGPSGTLFFAELHDHHLQPGDARWQVLASLRWPES
jgi:hypothetical protein